jgi:hypothetical protein
MEYITRQALTKSCERRTMVKHKHPLPPWLKMRMAKQMLRAQRDVWN